jgi:hypothetical protein
MATSLFLNGECAIYTGTGSGGALQELGVSIDGVTISEEILTKPVKIDTYGTELEYDMIYAGTRVTIDMELIKFDAAVLATVKQKLIWWNATLGELGNIGTFAVQNTGAVIRLLLQSPQLGDPRNYPYAMLVDADEYKYSASDCVTHKLRWRIMAAQQMGASTNALVYNNATS